MRVSLFTQSITIFQSRNSKTKKVFTPQLAVSVNDNKWDVTRFQYSAWEENLDILKAELCPTTLVEGQFNPKIIKSLVINSLWKERKNRAVLPMVLKGRKKEFYSSLYNRVCCFGVNWHRLFMCYIQMNQENLSTSYIQTRL